MTNSPTLEEKRISLIKGLLVPRFGDGRSSNCMAEEITLYKCKNCPINLMLFYVFFSFIHCIVRILCDTSELFILLIDQLP